jgi:hypothetical protein
VKITRLDLIGYTPIGNSVEILQQWSVEEDLSLLVRGGRYALSPKLKPRKENVLLFFFKLLKLILNK